MLFSCSVCVLNFTRRFLSVIFALLSSVFRTPSRHDLIWYWHVFDGYGTFAAVKFSATISPIVYWWSGPACEKPHLSKGWTKESTARDRAPAEQHSNRVSTRSRASDFAVLKKIELCTAWTHVRFDIRRPALYRQHRLAELWRSCDVRSLCWANERLGWPDDSFVRQEYQIR